MKVRDKAWDQRGTALRGSQRIPGGTEEQGRLPSGFRTAAGALGRAAEILEYNIAICLPQANVQRENRDESRQDATPRDVSHRMSSAGKNPSGYIGINPFGQPQIRMRLSRMRTSGYIPLGWKSIRMLPIKQTLHQAASHQDRIYPTRMQPRKVPKEMNPTRTQLLWDISQQDAFHGQLSIWRAKPKIQDHPRVTWSH